LSLSFAVHQPTPRSPLFPYTTLFRSETGAQLWSDRFDQPISDLASGQEQIVIRLRAALAIGLTDIEARRSARERPTSPDAFDLIDRKSTRLNSSHVAISYAVFCLKKK